MGERGQGWYRLLGMTGCWYETLPTPALATRGCIYFRRWDTMKRFQPSKATKSMFSTEKKKPRAGQYALVSKRQPIGRNFHFPPVPRFHITLIFRTFPTKTRLRSPSKGIPYPKEKKSSLLPKSTIIGTGTRTSITGTGKAPDTALTLPKWGAE